MTNKRLNGKTAIITGASQGLGQYLAIAMAREGARVVLTARNAERLHAIERTITDQGGIAAAMPGDLSKEDDCRAIIDQTVVKFGSIDNLVLNAGSATYGKLEELETFEPIRQSMEVNFYGAAFPTYLAMPHIIASKGLIAYVTSGAGHLPMAGYLGYTTSKHAMNGFFEALRLEMFRHGVDVLGVNPGDMYNDDGAGRTFFGPDGSQYKFDLSIKRDLDIPRVPASSVAEKVLEAIIERRREIDLSPGIQKLATRARPFVPGFVDKRISERAAAMRTRFDSEIPPRPASSIPVPARTVSK